MAADADLIRPIGDWQVQANSARAYRIRSAEPLLDPGNPALMEIGEDQRRRVVVMDGGLPEATQEAVRRYFAVRGCEIAVCIVEGGEATKDMQTIGRLLSRFQEAGLNRRTQPVIAVGGGATLDAAGFAASVYRRGVPYIRVPTTLLAYVDASVGIKTGINFGSMKNLVGSFTPPAAVYLDRGFLTSQDRAMFQSGLGEILKLAVGCEAGLLSELRACQPALESRDVMAPCVGRLLLRSIDIMLDELRGNLFEDELARATDLGHTFSQPLELGAGGATLHHGQAVAVDVNLSMRLAAGRGYVTEGDVAAALALSRDLGLPMTVLGLGAETFWASLSERTLHRGGRQRVPLPGPVGRCRFVDDLTRDEIARAVATFVRDVAAQPQGVL